MLVCKSIQTIEFRTLGHHTCTPDMYTTLLSPEFHPQDFTAPPVMSLEPVSLGPRLL